MKGNAEIIQILNDLLANELTAINQYFIHSKMCANWGFDKLAAKIREESIDEMRHADQIITRILYLEGIPNLQKLNKLRVGETVKEQFQSDLALEVAALKFLNDGVETARKLGDNGSEDLMKKILVSEEEHADWLETQLETMRLIGEQNYLAQQLA